MITKYEQKLIRTAEKLIKSTERVATLSSTKPRSAKAGNGGSIMLQRAKEAQEGAAKAWTDLVSERLADLGEAPRQPGRPGRKPRQAAAETAMKPQRGRNGRREANAAVAA